jgi:LDH2 family malate/lactate/ureidoglycolate dehydrogenase
VLVPGEREMDRLERHRRDGIPIEPALRAKLEAYASRCR